MRACRTARRGIFRFKFSYCDATRDFYEFGYKYTTTFLLRARNFYEVGFRAKSLQTKLRRRIRSKFAMRCEFDPAARRFLLCSTEFVPLRNDKIYGAI